MERWLDLLIPEHAYFLGFLQGDAHLTARKEGRAKGTLSVEVGAKDRGLLEKFQALVPVPSHISTRTRKTNFADAFECVCWRLGDAGLRQELAAAGLPEGKKSSIIAPPSEPHVELDYFRGLIDADGSVGLTNAGMPFLSLVTDSDFIAQAWIDFLYARYGICKTTRRNQRDNAYNIMVMKGMAARIAEEMYYDGCLALDRKIAGAREACGAAWPVQKEQRRWMAPEDALFGTGMSDDAISGLTGRAAKDVRVRRWRLSTGKATTQPASVLYPRAACAWA